MALKDDYILNMIRDLSRVLARLILGKDEVRYELPECGEFTAVDNLYQRLITMADEGKICEAENLLLEEVSDQSSEYFEMAASFYLYLNEFDDEYLESHDFSREEISEGIERLGKEFGVDLGGAEKWI